MPELVTFALETRGELAIVFVSGPDHDANRAFASQFSVNFPVLTQPDQRVAADYKVRVTPFAFYLDAEGVVRARGVVNRKGQLIAMVTRGRYGNTQQLPVAELPTTDAGVTDAARGGD